jgi:hypothetical protein
MIVSLESGRRLDLGSPNDKGEFVFSCKTVHTLHELREYSHAIPPRYVATLDNERALVYIEQVEYDDIEARARLRLHWLKKADPSRSP